MNPLPSLSSLTPEAIRILCAEEAGWTNYRYAGIHYPPLYTSSLDAVAELEAGLTDEEFRRYAIHLADVTDPHSGHDAYDAKWGREFLSAKPLAKCRAYLLTKGLVTL